MRVVGTLQKHPKIGTTVFFMNEKYIVKFEAGNMEQTFKFSTDIAPDLAAVDLLLTEDFISKVFHRFNDMYLSVPVWEK